jgi:tetrapyrrole methylase family protein/MazG family protein
VGSIAIVGLGAEGNAVFSPDTLARLKRADTVVVSNADGVVAVRLAEAGIVAIPLSDLDVEPAAPVERIVEELVALGREGDVAYVASGYPLLKEGMVTSLLARSRGNLDIYPVLSPLQIILLAFDIDLTADLDIVDTRSLRPDTSQRDSHLIVTGVRNAMLAEMVSERLASLYPGSHAAVIAGCSSDGSFSLQMRTILDLADGEFCEDSAVYVSPVSLEPPTGFQEFIRIISVLRSPDGCPWDRAQDHHTLRTNMLEEAYEAVAAIETGDPAQLADELGDVLLQVALHAQIASEAGEFGIEDVVEGITRKIRRRHPHVFGNATAETPEEVHHAWDAIKREEKAPGGGRKPEGTLDGIPEGLPALMYAQKMSRRAVGVGFEWETLEDVWDKVHEEIYELKATEPGSPEAIDEIGDLLFTVVNLARKQGIDAEIALRGTCAKFRGRFEDMERTAATRGESVKDLDITELEKLWKAAKARENKSKGADRS